MRSLAAFVVVALSTAAYADDSAGAKTLFDEGKALFAEGHYTEACAKLEASFKLAQLSSTRGLLGACYEKVGKLASAWAAYRDSAAISERQNNAERAQAARDKAAELEPKLARLTIDITAVAKIARVKIAVDGAERALDTLGSPLPVDNGPHVIAVSAPDYHPYNTTIDIQDGEKQSTVIPALVPDPTARLAEQARQRDIHGLVARRKLIAYSLAGGGAASLITATIFTLTARSAWRDAQAAGCMPDGSCLTTASATLARTASSRANLATLFGLLGAGLVGAGVTVYLTAPSERVLEGPHVTPVVTPTAAGVVLEGRF